MKLHKVKNLLPISAATITLVSNQGTADAATIYTVKKMTLSRILASTMEFQFKQLNKLIIR